MFKSLISALSATSLLLILVFSGSAFALDATHGAKAGATKAPGVRLISEDTNLVAAQCGTEPKVTLQKDKPELMSCNARDIKLYYRQHTNSAPLALTKVAPLGMKADEVRIPKANFAEPSLASEKDPKLAKGHLAG